MTRDDIAHLAFAICLIIIAGYVDAIGFLKLGGLFVSFMSGNSTQFAVVATQGRWSDAGEAGGLVLLFVLGVVFGHILALRAGRWRRPVILIVDAVLLGAAVLLAPSPTAMIPTVIAMGLQNEAQQRAGEIKTSLTYVTGTLVSLGEHLAGALTGSEPEKRWQWIAYLLLWLGLVIGAVIGAHLYATQQIAALRWPAIVLVVLAIATAAVAWRGRPKIRVPTEI
jgi:uncharacterized membrane protein YoaK (UPF0700 family)